MPFKLLDWWLFRCLGKYRRVTSFPTNDEGTAYVGFKIKGRQIGFKNKLINLDVFWHLDY
jgi:hypothetical protein